MKVCRLAGILKVVWYQALELGLLNGSEKAHPVGMVRRRAFEWRKIDQPPAGLSSQPVSAIHSQPRLIAILGYDAAHVLIDITVELDYALFWAAAER